MRFVAPLCAAVVLFAAACAPKGETSVKDSAATVTPPVVDVAAVRQAIDQANQKFADALTKGDSAGIVGNYSDDAMVMMPGAPAWRGRSEIAATGVQMLKSMTFSDVKFATESVDIGGDYAIETGTFQMTSTEKGKKPVTDKGKYVTVWKKQADGSWKIYRDINNSDGAAPKG